jgi:hypothetical protein
MFDPSLTTWKAQFARLERAYSRITQPYQSSVAYEDDLQHFFQDCWHLKDWIKNDPGSGVAERIESVVASHRALRIVADLANGSKHLRRHSGREGAYVTSNSVTVHLGQAKPIDVEYVITLADGTTMIAQTLAQEAFTTWQSILRDLGLIT